MNRNALIAIVAVILVLGAGWYFYSKGTSQQADTAAGATSTTSTTVSDSGGMKSLKDLIASNVSQQCSFDDSGTKGTMFIASGKIRGDFTSANVTGHMISDGQTVHTWMDGSTQGYTMAFTATESSSASAQTAPAQKGIDPDKKSNYSCSPWSADQSKFSLPAGIKFTDMSAMMQQAPSGGAGASGGAQVKGTAAQCSACDQAPAAYRAQCRAALHC